MCQFTLVVICLSVHIFIRDTDVNEIKCIVITKADSHIWQTVAERKKANQTQYLYMRFDEVADRKSMECEQAGIENTVLWMQEG